MNPLAHIKITLPVLIFSQFLSGCWPAFFDGKVAEVKFDNDIKIVRRELFYGDCFRFFPPVPTVYELKRTKYNLLLIHGRRSWARFYLVATSVKGKHLQLGGKGIRILKDPDLMHSKGFYEGGITQVTHFIRLEHHLSGISEFQVLIKDNAGSILGTENIRFEIKAVNCVELQGF